MATSGTFSNAARIASSFSEPHATHGNRAQLDLHLRPGKMALTRNVLHVLPAGRPGEERSAEPAPCLRRPGDGSYGSQEASRGGKQSSSPCSGHRDGNRRCRRHPVEEEEEWSAVEPHTVGAAARNNNRRHSIDATEEVDAEGHWNARPHAHGSTGSHEQNACVPGGTCAPRWLSEEAAVVSSARVERLR